MATYQEFQGQVEISSSNKDFSVGGNAKSITTGTYYVAGYSGETSGNLIYAIQVLIAASYAGSTVTMSRSTGLITINLNGNTQDIVWTDSALGDLLGFTSATTGASSYTADRYPRYVWRPSKGASDYDGRLSTLRTPNSTTSSYISPTGVAYTIAGNTTNSVELEYMYLTQAETIQAATTDYQSYEDFWRDVFHNGKCVRVIKDRTEYDSTDDYITCVWGDKELGEFSKRVKRSVAGYDGLYTVRIPLSYYI